MNIEKIRNIGIIAHVDAGKTTTTERMLYHTGITYKKGDVHDGNTVTDYDSAERERGITIYSASVSMPWNGYRINVVDTPGHIDFTYEVERSLRVLDGAVVVLCGVGGIEPQTETVWQQARKYDIPSIVFVNKLDRDGADYFDVLSEIDSKLGVPSIAIHCPVYDGVCFVGYVDILSQLYFEFSHGSEDIIRDEIPESVKRVVSEMSEQLYDFIDPDGIEGILDAYLENEKVSYDKCVELLRRKVIQNECVPVFCGSALNDRGIIALLDGIIEYLPSPNECIISDINETVIDTTDPFSAFLFKSIHDDYVGYYDLVRVYSGSIKVGDTIYNSNREKKERIGNIFVLRADPRDRESVNEANAGDIVAFTGLKYSRSGDTLCLQDSVVQFESSNPPEPLISVSLEPSTKQDETKLLEALTKLCYENPSLYVKTVEGQTLLSGVGELAIEVAINRLQEKYNTKFNVGKPRIEYRETFINYGEHNYLLKKQTGGKGMRAGVSLSVTPLSNGSGIEFINNIRGGVIPSKYISSVELGVREICSTGFKYGYPCVDISVEVFDGEFHAVDSSELAFKIAAIDCMKELSNMCKIQLLEPIFLVNILFPEEYMQGVSASILSRRGQIIDVEHGSVIQMKSYVPLMELFGYISIIRNITQGRGTVLMDLHEYQAIPTNVLEELSL